MATFTPVLTGEGRVFINDLGPGCGNNYSFYNCMKIDGLSKSLGDSESIYCPDPNAYNEFIEIASVEGSESRWTSTLTGRLPLNMQSVLEQLLLQRCSFDMQVHYGTCTLPSDFATFDAAFILRDVKLSSYDLTPLTALVPDERATVDESASITIGSVYRVFKQVFSQSLANAKITGSIGGIDICDSKSCGGICTRKSDGCQIIYTTHQVIGEELSILASIDGGNSWSLVDTDVASTTNYSPLICGGTALYFSTFNGTNSFIYTVEQSNVVSNSGTATLVATVANERVIDLISSENYVFAFGGTIDGYISAINISSGVVTEFENGNLVTGATITSGYAFDDDNIIFGTSDGQLLVSQTFGSLSAMSISVNNVNVTDEVSGVHMFDSSNWLASVGTRIICTCNAGQSWSTVHTVPSAGNFSFYDNITGYFQNLQGIYRTIDSGNTWAMVEDVTTNTLGKLKACAFNPNTVFATYGTPGVVNTDSLIVRGRGNTQVTNNGCIVSIN